MNAPPLLRPLRRLLQGALRPATARPIQNVLPRSVCQTRTLASVNSDPVPPPATGSESQPSEPDGPRMHRSLQALYLRPLRRQAEFGVPTCDLQLRSYSVRNLEFFCDFALRAAYYLNLPAYGPVPLPRLKERWTVPRSHFIFKKSQENFERITMRRLIQIRDGHPDAVQVWLAFLQKHAYYGIGMKANVWEFSNIDFSETVDKNYEEIEKQLWDKFKLLNEPVKKGQTITPANVEEWLYEKRVKAMTGIQNRART